MKETVEEAIKREYEVRKYNSDFPFEPQSFKLGAKWQQERMYSEEEVIELIQFLSMDKDFNGYGSVHKETANYFLEQFKKQ
jgi:hypothetical protein